MSEIKCTVRVTRPVLTDQERERRMKEIRKAMVELARAVEKQKKEEMSCES